jgi:hypothetical protein
MVHEMCGLVLVYHPAPGAARDSKPTWYVPDIPEYGSARFHPYEHRRWLVRSHIRELAENIVDAQHLVNVHGVLSAPAMLVETSGHILRASWTMKLATPRGEVDEYAESVGHGIGLWVMRFSGIVEMVFVSSLTPVDDDFVDVRFSFLVSRDKGGNPKTGVGSALIADVVKQIDQDIPIWENKRYWSSPVLGPSDKTIAIYRRWASQFGRPREEDGSNA